MISVRAVKAFIRTHNTFGSTKKEVLKDLEKIIVKKTNTNTIVKPVKDPMPKYIDMRGHVDRY